MQFLFPLTRQFGWRGNEYGCLGVIEEHLADDEASFYGLAEPNFVCQKITWHRICQDSGGGVELVLVKRDGRR